MQNQRESVSGEIFIQGKNLSKNYGGVQALKSVSIDIRKGEVHALIGENGAGKSTLGKIIAGAIKHDGGELIVRGESMKYSAPADAIRDGISIIDQELALLPMRSVLDNVFLGTEVAVRGVLQRSKAQERFAQLIEATGFVLDPDEMVGSLRLADQQKVEIMRALARDSDLIVMDEPSAALTPREVEQLHAIIFDLKAKGTTVVIVSHFLEEVLHVSDRVTILRDGAFIRTTESKDETPTSLVRSMLGRENVEDLDEHFAPELDPAAPETLRVEGLTRFGVLEDISFAIRAGEIVGLSGLVGSGRTEIGRAIFGADKLNGGAVYLDGERVQLKSPADAIAAGIAMLTESRKDTGLVMGRSIKENTSLAHLANTSTMGVIKGKTEKALVEDLRKKLDVKCSSIEAGVATLSGGNQQKVALGRWLFERPKVLIIDEPTRGVDVGAKAAIYRIIKELAELGIAVLVISSEIEEILALTHRIVVIARGKAVAELETAFTTKQEILEAAFRTVSPANGRKVLS